MGAWWGGAETIATWGRASLMLNFAIDEIASPQLRSHKGLRRWKRLAAPSLLRREDGMKPQQPLLSVRQLCVDYITGNGDVRAVNSVSF